MKQICVWCLIICFCLLFNAANAASGTVDPSEAVESDAIAVQIRDMVKDIRMPPDELSSLLVDMKMTLPLPLDILCQLRFRAPDKYSMRVYDAFDNTPVLIVDENLAMINDPFSENDVTIIASSGISFTMLPQGEQYNANFAFNAAVDGNIKDKVEIDLTTLFSRVDENLKLEKASDSGLLYFSGSTAQKSSCRAVFAPDAVFALRELQLFVEDNPVPVLSFPRISVGSEIPLQRFSFPLKELEKSDLKIFRLQPDGMLDTVMIAAQVIKAVFARSAIRSPGAREHIESMIGQKVDWEKIERQDADRSARLRKIFTVEP